MSWPYELKEFEEQWDELRLGGNGIYLMDKFAGTKIDITMKITAQRDVHFIY